MKKYITRMLIAIGILVGFLGAMITCAAPVTVERPSLVPSQRDQQRDGTVVVQNDNWSLVRVYYSENGGADVALGRAESMTKARFKFPVHVGISYRFAFHPLASSVVMVTDSRQIQPGDSVYVVVPNGPANVPTFRAQ